MNLGSRITKRFYCLSSWTGYTKLMVRNPLETNFRYHNIFWVVRFPDLKFGTNVDCMLKWTHGMFGRDRSVCSDVRLSKNNFLWSWYLQNLMIWIFEISCVAKHNTRKFCYELVRLYSSPTENYNSELWFWWMQSRYHFSRVLSL